MSKLFIVVFLVATSMAFPQNKNIDVDSLLEQVFGPKVSTTTATSTTSGDLDSLIDGIFASGPNSVSTSTTTTTKSDNLEEAGEACVIVNRPGICVKYYLCKMPVTISDGEIDIAGGQDIACANYLDACCSQENILDSPEK